MKNTDFRRYMDKLAIGMHRLKNKKEIRSYITWDTKTKNQKLKFVISIKNKDQINRFYFDPDSREDVRTLQILKSEIEEQLSRMKGN